ncbi:MAG TPA: manganese efflux pump [Solirubrobacteraceae bacterium]|nr:manganese efflux pump [Solirubrobacteraceae bacterium]
MALGAPLGRAMGAAADYLAIAVLLGFGLYALAWEPGEEARLERLERVRGPGALLLGLSVSLDELAIGFTLGLLRLPAALVIFLIAVQAFVLTQLGLPLGRRLGEGLREGAERLAGLALAGLALVLLAGKLVG